MPPHPAPPAQPGPHGPGDPPGDPQRAQREAWPAIEAAVAQACAGLKGDLLAQLAALEGALAERPLLQRVQEA